MGFLVSELSKLKQRRPKVNVQITLDDPVGVQLRADVYAETYRRPFLTFDLYFGEVRDKHDV